MSSHTMTVTRVSRKSSPSGTFESVSHDDQAWVKSHVLQPTTKHISNVPHEPVLLKEPPHSKSPYSSPGRADRENHSPRPHLRPSSPVPETILRTNSRLKGRPAIASISEQDDATGSKIDFDIKILPVLPHEPSPAAKAFANLAGSRQTDAGSFTRTTSSTLSDFFIIINGGQKETSPTPAAPTRDVLQRVPTPIERHWQSMNLPLPAREADEVTLVDINAHQPFPLDHFVMVSCENYSPMAGGRTMGHISVWDPSAITVTATLHLQAEAYLRDTLAKYKIDTIRVELASVPHARNASRFSRSRFENQSLFTVGVAPPAPTKPVRGRMSALPDVPFLQLAPSMQPDRSKLKGVYRDWSTVRLAVDPAIAASSSPAHKLRHVSIEFVLDQEATREDPPTAMKVLVPVDVAARWNGPRSRNLASWTSELATVGVNVPPALFERAPTRAFVIRSTVELVLRDEGLEDADHPRTRTVQAESGMFAISALWSQEEMVFRRF
ncbi:hypothetical protein BKA62DRAFT_717574 [Auriculariales sp. MPI-PUGE-AT-0066]|nr:hypothetical protein BKA62DRAFT_717574 [Auriculariales sp. MPI-PUGE-AT-0066]